MSRSKLLAPGDVVPFRLPQDISPLLLHALNVDLKENRSQAILSALELVYCKAGLTEQLVQALLTGSVIKSEKESQSIKIINDKSINTVTNETLEIGDSYASQSQIWLSMIDSI